MVAANMMQPAHGEEVVKYGQWVVACAPPAQEGAAKVCSAGQAVLNADKKFLFGWRFAYNAKNDLVATLRTRPGLDQSKGILIIFKPKEPSNAPYRECTEQYCETAFQVTRDQLAAMLGADHIKLILYPYKAEAKPIGIRLVTTGLKAALQALKAP